MGRVILNSRPWLKIRLSANLLSHTASAIVDQWNRSRKAAGKLAAAIVLYEELERGETEMLRQQFPWLLKNGAIEPLHKVYDLPTLPELPAPEFVSTELDEDELTKNFMASLGI